LKILCSPDLSWRDIQHLCVQTAQIINPEDPDWEKMATGRLFSYKYGFGVLNGLEYVTAARDWKLVKPQTWVDTPVVQINNGTMNITENMNGGEPIRSGGIFSTILVTKEMLESDNFETLEHVTIQVWISHTKRGDVEVELISPGKIRSVLAAPRAQDTATSGFPGWTFMSVKHWCVHIRCDNG
jgi:kexin